MSLLDSVATAFEAVIAGWDDIVQCEMGTQSGRRCRRPARWRLDLHGCELALLCGQHKAGWVKRAEYEVRCASTSCSYCRRPVPDLASLAAAYTVTPL